jgi:type IV pilus assembly protein PilW
MKHTHRQTGVTLIEMLISVAIGLVLAAAASYVYLIVQSSTRNLETQAARNETASLLLDIVGRDLKNAGYYPAHFPKATNNINSRGGFANIVNAAIPAFSQAIFGCSGAVFDAENGVCPAPVAGAPDSLVINYFTDDTFDRAEQGLRTNCLRNQVEQTDQAGVFYNRARFDPAVAATATRTTTVALPILISNVYALSPTTTVAFYTNQPVDTRSLRCRGNENRGGAGPIAPQPMVQGADQLVIRYGLFDPARGGSPERFYTATEVSNLPVVSVTKGPDTFNYTGWQRVASVQVCILTKTLDPNSRQVIDQGSYTDCYGNTTNYDSTDRAIYKLDTRTLTIRNNIAQTWSNS